MIYFSRRDIPLVYAGLPQRNPTAHSVLTIENYPKWYGFCLVRPDGTVDEVGFDVLQAEADRRGVSPYVDHVPNATLVPAVAEAMGWHLDPCSYEMMVGRWVSEALSLPEYSY